ncbi:hypothetical protein DPMN_014668 [Dreissena polymorpha]|uniref:Uncharacterized protein n=1 Tax=Dreissena polymorpha TaxID=45954 RepID=A0A9D4N6E7_DREPO|nr:hypothetical protein DPMN_014668 [Dreissena polymorpha]
MSGRGKPAGRKRKAHTKLPENPEKKGTEMKLNLNMMCQSLFTCWLPTKQKITTKEKFGWKGIH